MAGGDPAPHQPRISMSVCSLRHSRLTGRVGWVEHRDTHQSQFCEDDGLSEGLTHPTAYQLRSRDLVDRHLVRDAAQRHRLSVGFSPLVSSSKRSPDEPTGRANARPMSGSGISGFIMLSPACRCAHAGYLLEWNKNSSSKLEVEKSGGSHGSDNALPEMRKTNGPGCHPLRTHRPPMHQL